MNLLIIVGPTAVGKTELSIRLAEEINAEIVSADSMQVYRGMDIGTAKPTKAERARVPHHMIDAADPKEEFNVGHYLRMAEAAIEDIRRRGKIPLTVGGTGLYIRALTDGIFEGPPADWGLREEMLERERERPGTLYRELGESDPLAAGRIHPSDTRRIIRAIEVYRKAGRPISKQHEDHRAVTAGRPVRIAGLTMDRDVLYRRIEERVDAMMEAGFLAEVETLRAAGCTRGMASMQALGYRQLMAYLDGETTLEDAVRLIKRDTKRYAKRQFTWFNAEKKVKWVDVTGGGAEEALEAVKKALDIL